MSDESEVLEPEIPEIVEEPEIIESTEPTADDLLAAANDKYLRLAAEFDNFRRRSRAERDALYADVRIETVAKFLPVYDNLARALDTECADEAFVKGIRLTMTQLVEILAGLGVQPIPTVGEKFDASLHNAVSQVSEEGIDAGIITAEFQKGFTLGGKVIRHSIVVVNA
ncbi:MAG: nucleotide exchange factor GrpE [Oscillospiraceae bacterium]|jgi:molecular chaperone GrpE|nr:nucleotide exchange factor GrpE [Oscillospiraceae bacterium]